MCLIAHINNCEQNRRRTKLITVEKVSYETRSMHEILPTKLKVIKCTTQFRLDFSVDSVMQRVYGDKQTIKSIIWITPLHTILYNKEHQEFKIYFIRLFYALSNSIIFQKISIEFLISLWNFSKNNWIRQGIKQAY